LNAAKNIWKNDYFKSVLVIGIIVALVLGAFVGLRLVLNTPVPMLVVESGSMCVQYDGMCNGWSHPFDHTLHVGDVIIIQSVNATELNANYPNSDIIVYRNPTNPSSTPIVHRIVSKDEINGTLYFQTKGDGNGTPWPTVPIADQYDSHSLWTTGQGVPQDLVVGKVVMRIPWFGWITLFMRNNSWGLPVVIALILLLAVLEFVLPVIKRRIDNAKEKNAPQSLSASP
jgi:signal peptidase I